MGQVGESDLAAAVELLGDDANPRRPSGLTINRLAALTGLSRSTIYRRWETIEHFSDDWSVFAATEHPSWPQRLVALEPQEDLAPVVLSALADGPRALGPLARAGACSWSAASPVRDEVLAWERSFVADLADWFRRAAALRGRVFVNEWMPRVFALVTHALLEGACIQEHALDRGGPSTARRQQTVAKVVDWLIDVAHEGTPDLGPIPPPEPRPGPGPRRQFAPGTQRVLRSLCEVVEGGGEFRTDAFEPARVVDMAKLARWCGVTERALFARWPTAEGFNAALAAAVLTQRAERVSAALNRTIESVLAQRFPTPAHATFNVFTGIVVDGAGPNPSDLWALTPAFAMEEVQVAAATAIEAERAQVRALAYAQFALLDRMPRPELEPDDVVDVLVTFSLGAWRLHALDPALASATVTFDRGTVAPLFGVMGQRLAMAYAAGDAQRILL